MRTPPDAGTPAIPTVPAIPAIPAVPAIPAAPGDGRGAAGNARGAATAPPARTLYRIGIPDSVRAITSRWISLVPSKIV